MSASSQGTWVPSEEPASLLSCSHLSQTQAGDVAMATVPAATREAGCCMYATGTGSSGSFLSTRLGAPGLALQKDFLVKRDAMVTSWPCLGELEKTASFLCPSESAKDDTDSADGL